MPVKMIFSRLTLLIQLAVCFYGLAVLAAGLSLAPLGLVTLTAAPLLQAGLKFDDLHVPHHKVRLPWISLAVFIGLALVLLGVDRQSDISWLSFLAVGMFLLDTYWARD